MSISHLIHPFTGRWTFGATVSNAAMDIYVQVFVWTRAFILLSIYLGIEITGSYGKYTFNFFLKTAKLFSEVFLPLSILISNMWGSSFSTFSVYIWCCQSFLLRASLWVHSRVLIIIFNGISLMTNDFEYLLMSYSFLSRKIFEIIIEFWMKTLKTKKLQIRHISKYSPLEFIGQCFSLQTTCNRMT